jgi:hypothetical protein
MTEGRRSHLDRTADLTPYPFGLLLPLTGGAHWSAGFKIPSRALYSERARNPADRPRSIQIWPVVCFFLGISVYNFSRSANFNNSQKNKYKSFLSDSNFYVQLIVIPFKWNRSHVYRLPVDEMIICGIN